VSIVVQRDFGHQDLFCQTDKLSDLSILKSRPHCDQSPRRDRRFVVYPNAAPDMRTGGTGLSVSYLYANRNLEVAVWE
jgi:hypothetical protein